MNTLAVIKIARAIRRLVSAITPGTDPGVAVKFVNEAVEALAEALVVHSEAQARVAFDHEWPDAVKD